MFRVTKRFRESVRTSFQDDRGIAMVFVALLLIMLFGMVAFAIDTGALYQERRELQNGADAAVLAIAEDCGRGTTACDTSTVTATAEAYADGNAGDGRAEIHELILDTTAQSIEVATETETSDGGTIFRPFFAQVIGFTGTEVGARAKAIWGTISGASDLPLTISKCEWSKSEGRVKADGYLEGWYPSLSTGLGTYAQWEGTYGAPEDPSDDWDYETQMGSDPGVGVTITFHDGNSTEDCNANAGQDAVYDADGNEIRLSGGFGWLLTEGDCWAETNEAGWYWTDPGASPATGCGPDEMVKYLETIVFVPVFNELRGVGANGEFEMNGYMALYVTGYNFGGQYKESVTGVSPCKRDERCIQGYPTDGTCWSCHVTINPGTPNRGIVAVELTG